MPRLPLPVSVGRAQNLPGRAARLRGIAEQLGWSAAAAARPVAEAGVAAHQGIPLDHPNFLKSLLVVEEAPRRCRGLRAGHT